MEAKEIKVRAIEMVKAAGRWIRKIISENGMAYYSKADISRAAGEVPDKASKIFNSANTVMVIFQGSKVPFISSIDVHNMLLTCHTAKMAKMDVDLWTAIEKISTIERIALENIAKALKYMELKLSYSCDKYEVGSYSEKYNVIIEVNRYTFKACHEERIKDINLALKDPKWIYFNPFIPGYNIFDLINEINAYLTAKD